MLKGSILVFFGACSFGMLSTIIKLAYAQGFTTAQLSVCQGVFGVITLWSAFAIYKLFAKKEEQKETNNKLESPKTKWWKVALSGMSTGMVSVVYYKCVALLPASIAIILLMQYLWISVLLEYFLFKKKPSRTQLIAVIIVLVGTCFAGGLFSEEIKGLNPVGIVFGFLSALAYACFLMVNGRVGNDLNPLKKSALMVIGACTIVLVFFPPIWIFTEGISLELLKWGVPLALFGTVIPPLLFAYGIPKAGVTISAILSSVELPTVIVLSYFILKETIDGYQWIGIVLILIAMLLPSLNFGKKNVIEIPSKV